MSLIEVNNDDIGLITWQRADDCNFTVPDQVDIWRIDVAANLNHVVDFWEILNQQEKARAGRYLRAADRQSFIVSRAALRHILAGYLKQPPASIDFALETHKKPFIVQQSRPYIHFNLSDTAGQILIAVGHSAVGIDVELIKPDFNYHDIMYNYFTLAEGDYINQHDSPARFFTLWTRKEALLKATGVGLTDQLKTIPSLNGSHFLNGYFLSTKINWQLSTFVSSPGYIATLAVDPVLKKFLFYDFDL